MADHDEIDGALSGMDPDRRAFLKRMAIGAAAAPCCRFLLHGRAERAARVRGGLEHLERQSDGRDHGDVGGPRRQPRAALGGHDRPRRGSAPPRLPRLARRRRRRDRRRRHRLHRRHRQTRARRGRDRDAPDLGRRLRRGAQRRARPCPRRLGALHRRRRAAVCRRGTAHAARGTATRSPGSSASVHRAAPLATASTACSGTAPTSASTA